MKTFNKKPFIISRQSSKKSCSLSVEKGTYDQSLKRAFDSTGENQNQIVKTKNNSKNSNNLFKGNPSLLPDLLKRYVDDNIKYRDEQFTQQADHFLTRISQSKKIPKEMRAKYPMYFILVSICKIFMLNEYEIVVLGCALDHCNWKFEEAIYPEESMLLREFPGDLGNDIDDECKRLIIYFLVLAFSMKQALNDKGEVEKIYAYCENICINFPAILNRWTRICYFNKFNYPSLEVNKKFRHLLQEEEEEIVPGFKDYNIVVDTIMCLTGSYKSKVSLKPSTSLMSQFTPQLQVQNQTPLFASLPLLPLSEINNNKSLFSDPGFSALPQLTFERSVSRPKHIDFDAFELPPELDIISRQTSFQPEDFGRKKFKMNNGGAGFTLPRENGLFKDLGALFNNNIPKQNEIEDFLQMNPLPGLSKRSSTTSQAMVEELPSLFRFHSNMSSW